MLLSSFVLWFCSPLLGTQRARVPEFNSSAFLAFSVAQLSNFIFPQFFNEAKEATDYLRNLKDAIQRKYSCDRSSTIHKLEDLVQESMVLMWKLDCIIDTTE